MPVVETQSAIFIRSTTRALTLSGVVKVSSADGGVVLRRLGVGRLGNRSRVGSVVRCYIVDGVVGKRSALRGRGND